MYVYIFYPLFGYPVGAEAEVHSAIFIQFYEDFALFVTFCLLYFVWEVRTLRWKLTELLKSSYLNSSFHRL